MSSTYTVRVAFVDDTYWDDGSRWTSQIFKFNTQKEAIAFAKDAMKTGCTCKGQYGDVRTWPKVDDITVERRSTIKVKWE